MPLPKYNFIQTANVAAKKASGARLGNPRNLHEAEVLGRCTLAAEADRLAANVLPIVYEIRAAGARGLGAIAAALNRRGVRTARGGRWHVSTVRNLLARGVNPSQARSSGEPSPRAYEGAECRA